MSQHGRIDRDAGHAAPKAATPSRAREARADRQPRTDALFDDFHPESNDEGPIVAGGRTASPNPRHQSPGFQVLSDADAFLSEVAACESDRPLHRHDLGAFPLDVGFLSEDKGVPGSDLAHAIDYPPEVIATAVRESAEANAGAMMLPARFSGRHLLSTAVSLTALSTSFFVAVVLVTYALDRMNEALFTTGEPEAAERSVAGPVVADAVALAARPIIESTRFEPHATAVAARFASDARELPPPPIAVSAVVDPRTLVVEVNDRPVALMAAVPSMPSLAESQVLPLEPVQVNLAAPPPPPPPVVARAVSDSAGPAPTPLAAPNETDKIGGVLSRYRGAFNALDSSAARGVWPSVDARALDRAFARLQQQEVAFDRCDIDVEGIHAAARCTGSARYVPKVGSRTPQTAAREWRFNLHKVDDRWVIEEVDAR